MTLLNNGQKAAYVAIQDFLASDDKFFTLQSPAGRGKTFLLNQLDADLPKLNKRRQVVGLPQLGHMLYTASTNKAATLIGDAGSTIHSLFKIIPNENYKTGEITYQVKGQPIHSGILVIDEASMLEPKLHDIIDDMVRGTAKVIYSLDPYQLAPIGWDEPFVNTLNFPKAELTEPMRQGKDSFLAKTCDMLREAVKNQHYAPMTQGEGVRFVDGATFQKEYLEAFKNRTGARIIAFTNDRVEAHNKHVRQHLHGTTEFAAGDLVVAASSCEGKVKIEQTYHINYISDIFPHATPYRVVDLGLTETFRIPANKPEYFKAIKRAGAEAKHSCDWTTYFALKNNYLDIRDAFACTTHKSQGSTYEKVFVDFSDLCKCRDLNQFLRMLYVAVSRAKYEVVVYGL